MYTFQAMYGEKCVGAIVCKLDVHKKVVRRGYIAMLAVDEKYRQEKIGRFSYSYIIQSIGCSKSCKFPKRFQFSYESYCCHGC